MPGFSPRGVPRRVKADYAVAMATPDDQTRDHESWFRPGGNDAVPGFLTDASARAVAALLSHQLDHGIKGNLAEIGTYKGKTFVGLMKAAREEEIVVGFDLFPQDVETGFRAAVALLSPTQQARVVAVRKDTLELTTLEWMGHLRQPARFVHIDGGHGRAAIVSDLQIAAAFLTPRALVVLDDFLHDWYPDLTEGMIEGLRASRNLVPVAVIPRLGPPQGGGSKLVCATRDGADEYRTMLGALFQDKRPSMRRLAGGDVLTFQGF